MNPALVTGWDGTQGGGLLEDFVIGEAGGAGFLEDSTLYEAGQFAVGTGHRVASGGAEGALVYQRLASLSHMGAQAGDDFFIAEAGALGRSDGAAEGYVLQGRDEFLLGREVHARKTEMAGDALVVGISDGFLALYLCHEAAEAVDSNTPAGTEVRTQALD